MTFLIFVVVSAIVGHSIIWCVYVLSGASKKGKNRYIQKHKARIKNDADYQEYLRWMEKRRHDLPLDKVESMREREFEVELQRLMDEL